MMTKLDYIIAFAFINLFLSIIYVGIWIDSVSIKIISTIAFFIVTIIVTTDVIEDRKNGTK